MPKVSVSSITELVSELGGLTAASRTLNATPQVVYNWRQRGRIPTRLFLDHERKLSQLGVSAPVTLWGFEAPMTRGVAA